VTQRVGGAWRRAVTGGARDLGRAEALRAVTSVAAGVIGLGHRKGRIAPGFDAGILAVDGDPTIDPGSLHWIRAVYARGIAVPDAAPARFPG
jgi:imidazolonepropionase-like amidohydrolase